ncbi:apoptosis facilitator Bcl-2-like protein 14 [Tiliqua scincoides]|uniref:apoptosis facilitator Bcl-2-like protein 14 n=1 Tax=Tiliqua scincoides TaxID=71010 RepID=UPI0034636736
MNLFNSASLEEIPLEDVDRSSIEYRVFRAYAQRQLSSSKYGQLLESEQKSLKGSSGKEEMQGISPASEGKSKQGSPPQEVEKKKKKKKKSKWKRKLVPACLRGQAEPWKTGAPNGPVGVGSTCTDSSATQDDAIIALVADRLAEIVNNNHPRVHFQSGEFRALEHPDGLEEDGGWSSKLDSEDDHSNDKEEQIIDAIVMLLRNSGDELNNKMQKDKTFSQSFSELMSYTFFGKVADHFLEEALLDSATGSEVDVQSTRVAFAMEVIARLTAVDSHPMNLVLGFGMKYLKENFSPWIHSQGGWEKALGLSDAEEVE